MSAHLTAGNGTRLSVLLKIDLVVKVCALEHLLSVKLGLTIPPGDWTYPNTDALGLDEYFYWCEDMDLEPVLGVWAGFSLGGGGGTPLTGDALQPYIDDVLNELEVCCRLQRQSEPPAYHMAVHPWRFKFPIRCMESRQHRPDRAMAFDDGGNWKRG